MFKPTIHVILEYAPYEYLDAWRDIDDSLFDVAFEPLDIPKSGASAHTEMLCSDRFTISKVMKDRKLVSRLISDAIAEELVKKMSEKDTENGYQKTKEVGRG